MKKTAAVTITLLALSALASPTAASAAKIRSSSEVVACSAQLTAGGDLSVFGSPAIAGRNRLGDLERPASGRVSVSMVAGVFVDGAPDSSRAVYKVVPVAGLQYVDQWFAERRLLTGTAWISAAALRPSRAFLACEARLPVYAAAGQP